MKIRNGFVSNSSSTSFHIFGVEMTRKKLFSFLINKGLLEKDWENLDKYYEPDVTNEILENFLGKDIIALYRDYDEWDDNLIFYVGVRGDDMEINETLNQFEKRAIIELEKIFGTEENMKKAKMMDFIR